MLPMIVFDKTAFVRFKIINNLKQNIDEPASKQPKIHWKIRISLWYLKISRKNQRTKSLLTYAKSL
jgi:hypothetical protein